LREGEQATPDELIELCRTRLAEWEVPAEIEFRHDLPKTFVGKVLRRALVTEDERRITNDKAAGDEGLTDHRSLTTDL
jgi:long-chain acyl-CoA synthetase